MFPLNNALQFSEENAIEIQSVFLVLFSSNLQHSIGEHKFQQYLAKPKSFLFSDNLGALKNAMRIHQVLRKVAINTR